METFREFIIKEMAHDPNYLSPTDIYNFYYLWSGISYDQIHGEELPVALHYIMEIRQTYLNIFARLLTDQIKKYVGRGRIDMVQGKPAFDVKQLNAAPLTQKIGLIKQMMAQTYRSDMKRRNDVWDAIADHLYNLSMTNDPKKSCYYIDRINNSIHNTKTLVLEKFPNGGVLLKALGKATLSPNPTIYRKYVDPELRGLMSNYFGPGRT